jgi:hypothetical protein
MSYALTLNSSGALALSGDVRRDRFQAQPVADGFGHGGLVLDH